VGARGWLLTHRIVAVRRVEGSAETVVSTSVVGVRGAVTVLAQHACAKAR
jgi:hypothetical protein